MDTNKTLVLYVSTSAQGYEDCGVAKEHEPRK